ncbi:cadherin-23-like [Saccoglossus kowalevskii]
MAAHAIAVTFLVIVTNILTKINGENTPPFCVPDWYTFGPVIDGTVGPSHIGNVSCSDHDSDNVYYSVISGDTEGAFNVSEFGSIELKAGYVIDFEASTSYELLLEVTDLINSTTVTVYITVTSRNEYAPVFNNTIPYSAEIYENASVGGVFLTVSASDGDHPDTGDGRIRYAVTGGDPDGQFRVGLYSGGISPRLALDRETTSSYTIEITATDEGAIPRLFDVTNVSITVLDVNDNTPYCDHDVITVSVDENLPILTNVTSLRCDDDDDGPNSDLVYSILKGNTVKFRIDIYGVVLINSLIDYETDAHAWSLTINVADQGDIPLSTTVDITVILNPVNEWPVVFPGPTYGNFTFSVYEDANPGFCIGDVHAVDNDIDAAHTIQYTWLSGNEDDLFLIGHDGMLYVIKQLDREAMPAEIQLRFQAHDNSLYPPVIGNIMIEIIDVNDNAPFFNQTAIFVNLKENVTVEVEVAILIATDLDVTSPNSDVNYNITDGNEDKTFHIDAASGNLTSVRSSDYETMKSRILRVIAEDMGVPPLTSSITVYVDIIPVNEFPPVITSGYAYDVSRDANIGHILGKVLSKDEDSGRDGEVRFHIQSAITLPIIVDHVTGELILISTLDREINTSFEFVVIVTDNPENPNDILSATQTIVVNINDANQHAPEFNHSTMVVHVKENITIGEHVITLEATDLDMTSPNNNIHYNITAGNEDGVFIIDGTTGDVTVAMSLNSMGYILPVIALDGGIPSLTSSITIYVDIIPVNQFKPVITSDVHYNVSRDANIGHILGQVFSKDEDNGRDGEARFRIVSERSLPIIIDHVTGELILISELDREMNASFEFVVIVTDNPENPNDILSATQTIVVNINDANQHAPHFPSSTMIVHVKENITVGENLITLKATDLDMTSPNKDIYYNITAGNEDGRFIIDDTSGDVTVATTLDSTKSYILRVSAVDGGIPSLTSSITIYVDIISVNQFKPVITSGFIYNVSRDADIGYILGKVLSTDEDDGRDGEVGFNIDPERALPFVIDHVTGEIMLISKLEREANASFEFVVIVTDNPDDSNDILSATQTIVVNINDVNQHTPYFSSSTMVVHVKENITIGEHVITLEATDLDMTSPNNDIHYNITAGNEDGRFIIDDTSGDVTVAATLDATKSYALRINAVDGGIPPLTSSITIYVDIKPVNQFKPVITSGFIYNVSRDAPVGQTVGKILSQDGDDGRYGEVRFSIYSEKTLPIVIDHVTGELILVSTLDREVDMLFEFVVTVTDNPDDPNDILSSTQTIVVYINDANQHAPELPYSTIVVHVYENATVGEHIVSLNATDLDITSSNNDIYFTITDGDEYGQFTVDPASGVLSVAGFLDCETMTPMTSYILTVGVEDGGTPSLTSFVTIYVDIIPMNEFPPVITSGVHYNVSRDADIGYILGTVFSNDQDFGRDGVVRFSIKSEETSPIVVDHATGELILISTLDQYLNESLELIVTVTDNPENPTNMLSATQTIVVTIKDINQYAPEFETSTVIVHVQENITAGEPIITLIATDYDVTSPNNDIRYKITAGEGSDRFNINAATGEITLIGSLDYELPSFMTPYTILVTAEDGGTPSLTSSIGVYVKVIHVNEFTPVITSGSSYNVSEHALIGHVFGKVLSTDQDAGRDGEVNFNIQSEHALPIAIDYASGNLFLISTLDREINSSYEFVIIVADNAENPGDVLSTSHTITVSILDVNDNVPVFDQLYPLSVSLNELTTPDEIPFHVFSASDPDEGVNSLLTYAIESGNENGVFSINTVTGELTLVGVLDYETTPKYELWIIVHDNGNPSLTSSTTIHVNVAPANEHAPVLTSPSTYWLSEDAVIGTIFGQLLATDEDVGEDGNIKFSIESDDNLPISVNQVTGELFLTGILDREGNASYEVVAVATDTPQDSSKALSGSQILRVNIDDVNDNHPLFDEASFVASLSETTTTGLPVLNLLATDPDDGSNAELLFAITAGNDDSVFEIDRISGEISLILAMDYESVKSYTLNVTISDQGTPALTSSSKVSIEVTPENEFAPIITSDVFYEIREDAAIGHFIGHVLAVDDDHGQDGHFLFNIESATVTAPIAIDHKTGELFLVSKLDRETTSSYELIVVVTDTPRNPEDARSTSVTITITVNDANDNTPKFDVVAIVVSLPEMTLPGLVLTTLMASDPDEGKNAEMTFNITAGNEDGVFDLDSTTGHLTLQGQVNYESNIKSYILSVDVTDQGIPSLKSVGVVYVEVVPQNEHAPVIVSRSHYNIPEDAPKGSVICQIVATDDDDGMDGDVRFIIQSPSYIPFSIDHVTGEVFLVSDIDRETLDYYEFVVMVTDRSGNPVDILSVSQTITVAVDDVNDNQPRFDLTKMRVSVSENAFIGENLEIFSIYASDQDIGSNAEFTFHITGGNDEAIFGMNTTTGDVSLVRALDYETTKLHLLELTVRDSGLLSSTATLQVLVGHENEHAPTITGAMPYLDVSMPEDTEPGNVVLTVEGDDQDDSIDGKFVFSLDPGTPFIIDRLSGEVILVKELDREAITSHELKITITDLSTSNVLSSSATSTITVVDVNDNPPNCTVDISMQPVYENLNVGGVVAKLSCNDGDTGVGGIEYKLVAGEGSNHFSIDPQSGAIKVAVALDYEVETYYSLYIEAADHDIVSFTTSLNIPVTVIDVNDNWPLFILDTNTLSVMENVVPGTKIAKVAAYDVDSAPNADIYYNIFSGDDEGQFEIDSLSGIVSVTATLDRETIEQYVFVIHAADSGFPELTGSSTITLNVLDINDEPPLYTENVYNNNVDSDVDIGTTIMTVTANDPDLGPGGEILYNITYGDDFNLYDIDPVTGDVLTTHSLIDAAGVYALVVTASDKGDPSIETDVTVVIEVMETIAPLTIHDFIFAIAEDAAIGSEVGTVVGNRENLYVILASNVDGYFNIDETTGVIRTSDMLDRETIADYTLVVHAESEDGMYFSTADVRIVVLDTNDNTPVFANTSYSVDIIENLACGTSVLQVTASDKDSLLNRAIIYSIDQAHTTANEHFNIDSRAGIITVKVPPDYELTNEISFNVIATDSGLEPRSSSVSVAIVILDEDFDGLCYDPPIYSIDLRHDRIGGLVEVLNNSDFGFAGSRNYTYAPVEDTNVFTVHPFGEITLNAPSSNALVSGSKTVFRVVARVLQHVTITKLLCVSIYFYFPRTTIVTVYVVTNPISDFLDGIEFDKRFMDIDELLTTLQKQVNGTPADILMTDNFAHFHILSVTRSLVKTPWIRTMLGILFTTLSSFGALCLLVLTLLLCCCRKNMENDKVASSPPVSRQVTPRGGSRASSPVRFVYTLRDPWRTPDGREDRRIASLTHKSLLEDDDTESPETYRRKRGTLFETAWRYGFRIRRHGEVAKRSVGGASSEEKAEIHGKEKKMNFNDEISLNSDPVNFVRFAEPLNINNQMYDGIGQEQGSYRFFSYNSTTGSKLMLTDLTFNERERLLRLFTQTVVYDGKNGSESDSETIISQVEERQTSMEEFQELNMSTTRRAVLTYSSKRKVANNENNSTAENQSDGLARDVGNTQGTFRMIETEVQSDIIVERDDAEARLADINMPHQCDNSVFSRIPETSPNSKDKYDGFQSIVVDKSFDKGKVKRATLLKSTKRKHGNRVCRCNPLDQTNMFEHSSESLSKKGKCISQELPRIVVSGPEASRGHQKSSEVDVCSNASTETESRTRSTTSLGDQLLDSLESNLSATVPRRITATNDIPCIDDTEKEKWLVENSLPPIFARDRSTDTLHQIDHTPVDNTFKGHETRHMQWERSTLVEPFDTTLPPVKNACNLDGVQMRPANIPPSGSVYWAMPR